LAASSSTFALRSSTAFQLHSSFCIAVRPCGGTELAAHVLEHDIPHLLTRGRADMKKEQKSPTLRYVGLTWVHEVGKVTMGDKNIMFLAEILPKLRFLQSFHFLVIMQPYRWVRCEGPELGEKSFQLSSLLISYNIDR
jgi:hypothetical protein